MKQVNSFKEDFLDLEQPEFKDARVWLAGKPNQVLSIENKTLINIPFTQIYREKTNEIDLASAPRQTQKISVQALGPQIIRLSLLLGAPAYDITNPMLKMGDSLKPVELTNARSEKGWEIRDLSGKLRMSINTEVPPVHAWTGRHVQSPETFSASILPDGSTEVPFVGHDLFFGNCIKSMSLGYVELKGKVIRTLFSFQADHAEKFAGTGERFTRMNLSGSTVSLDNEDAQGSTSGLAYKNIPFYLSSRGYGIFINTTAHVKLSFAHISTRAAQGLIEDGCLDLFIIGGGKLERILNNYRSITGFPPAVPKWSYGVWMSRVSYFSAQQVEEVGKRLRNEKFPCDAIHVDTGWFTTDRRCDWKFDPGRFPEPGPWMKRMREKGFRISLWQCPSVNKETDLYQDALQKKFILPKAGSAVNGDGNIDLTNPSAVQWYQGMLETIVHQGVRGIKVDFGETLEAQGTYRGMSREMLHNCYALLYQRAAWEALQRAGGSDTLTWSRSAWAGSQCYPVHWGGDCACTWDGLAGDIRGGLHLGLSGFAFRAGDVPGFHGAPDFMNSAPAEDLYVRWTQAGVFMSHLCYHGTSPREPYEFPGIADIVRPWWNLRYSLIPYLIDQSKSSIEGGYPLMRPLVIHHQEDPACWDIDDQYYCGESLLVAPILNSEGERNVYLPAGKWIDFWTGEHLGGCQWRMNVKMPLSRIPVYARSGASIRIYPSIVQCTDLMKLDKSVNLTFNDSYKGFKGSLLGKIIEL